MSNDKLAGLRMLKSTCRTSDELIRWAVSEIEDLRPRLAAAMELIEEIPRNCDKEPLNGPRRYWCMTHSEYGSGDGCLGERAKRFLKEETHE